MWLFYFFTAWRAQYGWLHEFVLSPHELRKTRFATSRPMAAKKRQSRSKSSQRWLREHFDDTFGKFASEVGWRNNAGKVITPWTTKRHKMLQHSKHQIADDNSISERYTILDDALYEFAMARVVPVDNQSIFHKFGNFSFSENVTQSLNKYFQMPTNNCSTPCCEKCRFQFKWGKHLNHLFVNSAKWNRGGLFIPCETSKAY